MSPDVPMFRRLRVCFDRAFASFENLAHTPSSKPFGTWFQILAPIWNPGPNFPLKFQTRSKFWNFASFGNQKVDVRDENKVGGRKQYIAHFRTAGAAVDSLKHIEVWKLCGCVWIACYNANVPRLGTQAIRQTWCECECDESSSSWKCILCGLFPHLDDIYRFSGPRM